jgi:hypothetical protein
MSIPDKLSDTIATPEGDGEADPGVPLAPEAEDLLVPPGSAPNPYDSDKTKPRGLEKFIDEVADGEFM